MKLIDKSKLPRERQGTKNKGGGAPSKPAGSPPAPRRRSLAITFGLWRQGRQLAFLGPVLLLALASLYFDQKKVGSHAVYVSAFIFQRESSTPAAVENNADLGECPLEPCNLSIVFIGDSLTRFMYISLAYFLHHNNTWIDPDSLPNLVDPNSFLGGGKWAQLKYPWTPFYNASTLALAPYEVCDCFRGAGSIQSVPGKDTVCENRYFWDPIRNNSVVYFQAYGTNKIPLRGHFLDPVAALRRQWPPTLLNEIPWLEHHPFNWTYTWSDLIRYQVAPLRPSVLILNAGHWSHNFQEGNPGFVQEFLSAIHETLWDNSNSTEDHQQHQHYKRTQVIWKTTTPQNGGTYPHAAVDRMMCGKLAALQNDPSMTKSCLNLTDALLGTPPKYYLDGVHFREPGYRVMNEQLLLDTLKVRIQLPSASPNDVDENATAYYYQRFDTAVHWPPPPTLPPLESFRH